MYYIISLTHTRKHSDHICLWRPNNAGYCYSQESAGLYAEPQKDYHDSDINMPVEKEILDKLFLELPYMENVNLKMIPNCKTIWNALKVKMTKDGLRRIF
jgi:hypothetical protein